MSIKKVFPSVRSNVISRFIFKTVMKVLTPKILSVMSELQTISTISLFPPTHHITHSLFLPVSFSHSPFSLPVSLCAFLFFSFSSLSPSSSQASLYFSVPLNLFLYQPLTLPPSYVSLSLFLTSLQLLSLTLSHPSSLFFFSWSPRSVSCVAARKIFRR